MQYTQRRPEEGVNAEEALKLRQEVQDLRRQLQEQREKAHGGAGNVWHPSPIAIGGIVVGLMILAVVAFFAGYIPLRDRDRLVRSEASEEARAVPRVDVIQVGRASTMSELDLPGNIQAITEAP